MNSLNQLINEFLAGFMAPQAGGVALSHAFLAMAIAYAGGVLASLTPCVYPMIPITVSVVGGMGPNRRAWHEVWLRGMGYVLGMAIIYSSLGVLAGLTGRVFGTFTNTPGWYLGLGLVLSLGALIMLEVFPFDPGSWWNQFRFRFLPHRGTSTPPPRAPDQGVREVTFWGAMALGASSGFIAAPCTTPVLTSILAFIAKTQSVGFGLALMLAFSLGLGTLLLLIAAFAGALQILPRSGQWMKTVKVASGLLLMIVADYMIYRAGILGGM